ncbi:hypothetical protein BDQ17DRAFT_1329666 [Cyathus striatus]|nr:hypothetical protein BDQ17DRAFT_1329666 [Cyathus striatus]
MCLEDLFQSTSHKTSTDINLVSLWREHDTGDTNGRNGMVDNSTSNSSGDNKMEQSSNNIPSFSKLADDLIADATEADEEAHQNSSEPEPDYCKLQFLFDYPTEVNPSPSSFKVMLEFWQKAMCRLQWEAAFHDFENEHAGELDTQY